MKDPTLHAIKPVERLLVQIDAPPFDAIHRVLIGLLILPASSIVVGADASWWRLAGFVVAVLGAIRVVPAVLRKVLPFPPEVDAVWRARRMLAKKYDSYQWQKLFWFGLGMAAAALAFEPTRAPRFVIASICSAAGLAGLVTWRFSGARAIRDERSGVQGVRTAWQSTR